MWPDVLKNRVVLGEEVATPARASAGLCCVVSVLLEAVLLGARRCQAKKLVLVCSLS